LQRQGRGGQLHGATIAVLVLLTLSDQFSLPLREGMGVFGSIG
jgi:hypothetical protein